MIFTNYGRYVPRSAALTCRDRALDNAFRTHGGQINTQMGLEEHQYRVDSYKGTVVLSLSPAPGMTWGCWMAEMIGLASFWSDYETMEMIFVVRRRGEEAVLALGHLVYVRIEVEDVGE